MQGRRLPGIVAGPTHNHRMPGSFDQLQLEPPFVVRDRGTRSLHFTYGELQSRMRDDRPEALQVDYTRTMMGFLLLLPRPAHITQIGLGGGSLLKFCHHHLPDAAQVAVENNPGVLALRDDFGIPPDGPRLQVVLGDGARYVAQHPDSTDVLMIDGFDAHGQPPQLCSPAFYLACLDALHPGGVLVVNLHADDPQCGQRLQDLGRVFRGNGVHILAQEKSNCVVLAGRELPVDLRALRRASAVQALPPGAVAALQGEFAHIGWHAQPLPA